jgi:hypothetical protein
MLAQSSSLISLAMDKASLAYGDSVKRDLHKSISALGTRKGRLEECMAALKINEVPRALLWDRIRNLKEIT